MVHYRHDLRGKVGHTSLFFSILTRRLLRRGEFASRDDLVAKIMGFITDYDATAGPFKWGSFVVIVGQGLVTSRAEAGG